jgi:benzoate transport
MTNPDPRQTLANAPMSRFQVTAWLIAVGLNALDGFDVLAISFASPGIASEWGIDRAALGFVLAMEQLGMAMGSILLGGVADRMGRRPMALGCLVVMATGMIMATTATNIYDLAAWRVLTGLGIGGMLPTITAIAAENASEKRRNLCVAIVGIGYPLGAVVGGTIAALLLRAHDWRSVFVFGAIATACFIPLVWWRVPESVFWLCQRQPRGALERVNRTLGRLGHAAVAALPAMDATERRRSVGDIFRPALARTTLLVTLAYSLHIATFYFILKWVPKIVVDMGFAPASAAGVLVWANVGGAAGGALLGLLSLRFGVKALTMATLLVSTVMVIVFGGGQANLAQLSLICAVTGFFTNAGVVGMYAIFPQAFPTHVRATGTGFAIGVGRGSSIIAPILAGYLFEAGYGLQAVAVIMGVGSLCAALALALLRLESVPVLDIPKMSNTGTGHSRHLNGPSRTDRG